MIKCKAKADILLNSLTRPEISCYLPVITLKILKLKAQNYRLLILISPIILILYLKKQIEKFVLKSVLVKKSLKYYFYVMLLNIGSETHVCFQSSMSYFKITFQF